MGINKCLNAGASGFVLDLDDIGQDRRAVLCDEVSKVGARIVTELAIEHTLSGSDGIFGRDFGLRRSNLVCESGKATL
jgi:hypothetical protein